MTHLHDRFTACGHLNGNSKLTPEQIIEIRRRYARRAEKGRRVTMAQLAREYGITTTHCSRILHHETWQHIT